MIANLTIDKLIINGENYRRMSTCFERITNGHQQLTIGNAKMNYFHVEI